jgi:hypothetical protein
MWHARCTAMSFSEFKKSWSRDASDANHSIITAKIAHSLGLQPAGDLLGIQLQHQLPREPTGSHCAPQHRFTCWAETPSTALRAPRCSWSEEECCAVPMALWPVDRLLRCCGEQLETAHV